MVKLTEEKVGKKDEEIKTMEQRIPELRKTALIDFGKNLLLAWLKSLAFVFVGVVLSLIVSHFVTIPISPFEESKIEDIAKALIGPILSMNGLLIAFVPVIGFFYINEVKEEQRETKEQLDDARKRHKRKEDVAVISQVYGFSSMIHYNLRVSTQRYLTVYLTVGLVLSFLLVYLYILSSSLFLLTGLLDLIVLLFGIPPILNVALRRRYLRLVEYLVPEKQK